MPNFLLIRSADHVLLGVSWSGLAVAGTGPDGVPVLKAVTDDARLVLIFPPQHVAEETSLPNTLPQGSGAPVPVWRAALSGPSRLAFTLPRGTSLVPTAEGVLQALAQAKAAPPAAPPGPRDTALELPWKMIFAPEGRGAGHEVRSVHPAFPVTVAGVCGLWQARLLSAPPGSTSVEGTSQDASLALRAVDPQTAGAADPPFTIPLNRAERTRLAFEAAQRPASATRLELSALGGTLSARGWWENFQWEQETVLGRDIRVRTLTSGRLYPLGHRAEYLELSERIFDPSVENAAVLRSVRVLTVTEPVRRPPPEGPVSRAFPFGEVEITTLSYPDLADPDWQSHPTPAGADVDVYFRPSTAPGEPVAFPIRCATPEGDVRFELPLLFVADLLPGFDSLADPGLAAELAGFYGLQSVRLPGVPLDLVRANRAPEGDTTGAHHNGDVHEVHGISIGGTQIAGGQRVAEYRPLLESLEVRLPSLRTLLGEDIMREVRFTQDYLNRGAAEDVLLELAEDIDISFVGRTDRSGGLVAPHLVTNAISRTRGPIDLRSLPDQVTGLIDPGDLFPSDATLLGFALKDLVSELKAPPEITSLLQPGRPPSTKMEWKGVKAGEKWEGVKLGANGPFQPVDESRLFLTVTVSATGTDTHCEVRDFALVLPSPSRPLLRLQFKSLTFTQSSGGPPRLQVEGVKAEFLGELQLLQELQEQISKFNALEPYIDVTTSELVAHYSLPLPSVTAGAFVMRDFAVNTELTVPFDGRPLSVSLGFASRENPFTLALLMFGGGGYLDLEVDHSGLRRLEGALEFGAMLAVDFLIARGEVHAFGGIRFELADGEVSLTGYLRIGGCVEVLGLVAVSIELCIEMAYQSSTKALVGRATLIIEIDLTLWSDSVELDSGTWVLAGGGGAGDVGDRPVLPSEGDTEAEGLARWRAYQAAFVPPSAGDQS